MIKTRQKMKDSCQWLSLLSSQWLLKGWPHYGYAEVWAGSEDCPSRLIGTRLYSRHVDISYCQTDPEHLIGAFLIESQSCWRNNPIQVHEVTCKSFVLENAKKRSFLPSSKLRVSWHGSLTPHRARGTWCTCQNVAGGFVLFCFLSHLYSEES